MLAVSIDLGLNSKLSGTLPPELGNLVALEFLDVSGLIHLSGTVPTSYANLSRLEVFNAKDTPGVRGPYPVEICNNGLSAEIVTRGGVSDCPCCVTTCTKSICDEDVALWWQ